MRPAADPALTPTRGRVGSAAAVPCPAPRLTARGTRLQLRRGGNGGRAGDIEDIRDGQRGRARADGLADPIGRRGAEHRAGDPPVRRHRRLPGGAGGRGGEDQAGWVVACPNRHHPLPGMGDGHPFTARRDRKEDKGGREGPDRTRQGSVVERQL